MDINELVANYVKLRDQKAALVAHQKEKVRRYDDVLDKIEGMLLQHMQDNSVESLRTESGTAFRSTRESATIADWDAFLAHVRATDAWEMLEHRCSKVAVSQYRETVDDLPPGVSWRAEVVVGVRRA